MRRAMAVRLEPCASPCAAAVVSVSLLAIVAAFLVAGLLLRAYGMRFPHDYVVLLHSTLGDPHGRAEVVRKTIPLLLAGIGLVVAFRAQCWNIGAEGQMLAGAIAAAGMALFVPLPPPWMLPAMFAAGALSGALCGCLPALLRVQLGVNEVLTTLMLNYIVLYLVQWLIHGPWKGKSALGFAYTDTFPEAAWLPLLPGTRVHWPTLLLGLLLAVGVALLLSRMRLGYEIRVVGQNPEAARYTGMNFLKVLLLVMGLSGAAAGLAGVGEVAGIHHKLLGPTQISLGYGYTAIIVAWLARGRVLATLCTAPLMGWIFASGDVMKGTLHLPFQVVDVMNGLLLFCLIGGERLMYYRVRWERHKQPAVHAGANPPL